jgi:site-specific DNA-cytosine methylase
MNLVDCQLLAGSGLIAAKRLGITTVQRVSYGFGDKVVGMNRPLVGDFQINSLTPHGGPENWTAPRKVDILAGCPPCSGWSVLNFKGRGAQAPAHKFTWDFIRYATKLNSGRGPTAAIWECVQPAYREGQLLMEQYFDYLCTETRSKYKLTHVLMSGASVGSASERKRYFWVASKVPFGVDCEVGRSPVTVGDRLADSLYDVGAPTDETWAWPHKTVLDGSATGSRILEMVLETHALAGGKPGYTLQQVAMELKDKNKLPKHLRSRYFDSEDCWIGFPGPKVLDPAKPCPVITGGAAADFLHPWAPRFLTVYEFGRLMGYPPEWQWPGHSVRKAVELIGKGVPVENWQWILQWVRDSLDGNPGPLRGRVVDVTYAWQGQHKVKVYE